MTFYENVEVGPPTKSNQGAPNETVTPLRGCLASRGKNPTKCCSQRVCFGRQGGSVASDPDLGIVPLSVALGTVAAYGKSLCAPFAERVFEKACADIEGWRYTYTVG